jgi:hypothetical protein
MRDTRQESGEIECGHFHSIGENDFIVPYEDMNTEGLPDHYQTPGKIKYNDDPFQYFVPMQMMSVALAGLFVFLLFIIILFAVISLR